MTLVEFAPHIAWNGLANSSYLCAHVREACTSIICWQVMEGFLLLNMQLLPLESLGQCFFKILQFQDPTQTPSWLRPSAYSHLKLQLTCEIMDTELSETSTNLCRKLRRK